MQGRLCAEEFSEILLLCGNGYGVAALRLVRGMFERTVTTRYLSEHPDAVDNYLDYYWISQHRLMGAIRETFGPGVFGDDKEEEMEQHFQNVKAKFMVTDCKKCDTKRLNHTWSKLDFVAMARATGELGKLIVPAYYLPTKEIHSTIGAVLSRLDGDAEGLVFEGGGQHKRADEALISAHNLILNCLKLQETYFQLDILKRSLEACYADFFEIWGSPKTVPGQ